MPTYVNEVQIDDDFIKIKADDTIISVAKAIAKAGVPDAVVVDESDKVLGILDDYDIVSKVLAEEKDPKVMTAKDVMYAPPLVKLDFDLDKVYEIMQQMEASMLPVVDNDLKLLGVITLNDVLEDAKEEPKGIMSKIMGLFGR
ncbi:MAG: CBS domain-containing protein [Candidatus Heimdallarchaeota archaeon]|nr:CBS domain-containing protein [Candidatus Heimdallarchaeota archaeon]